MAAGRSHPTCSYFMRVPSRKLNPDRSGRFNIARLFMLVLYQLCWAFLAEIRQNQRLRTKSLYA